MHLSQGQLDIPLNKCGQNQAHNAALKLQSIKFDQIISSPMKRAKETAQIINKQLQTKLVFDERITETFLGIREGVDFFSWPADQILHFRRNPEDFGGESNQTFYERVASFCKDIEKSDKNILIVSHGGVYKNIYRYFNNIKDFTTTFPTPETCEVVKIKGEQMKKEVIITNKLRIAITNQCNLSCFYCHNEGQEHCQAKKYLSLDYIKQLSKWFVDNNVYVQVLNITGGEPLLHKDLIPILDECRKFTDIIHLNTNATLLSKEKIDELKAHGVTDIKVGIDSVFAKQSKPNIYTSPIGIEKVLENIKYANSIMGVELNTVLTHYNHEDIDKMIEFANEAKVNSIKVIQLFDFDPYKYNDRSDKEASLKTNDTKVQDYFFDVRQKYLDQAFHYDWYPSKGRVSIFLRREDGSEFELLFCEDVCNSGACGNMFTPIDADGNLMVCPKFHITRPIDFSKSYEEVASVFAFGKNNMCNSFTKNFKIRDNKGIID